MLIDECVDDPVLKKVLDAMLGGSEKAQTIAKETGLDIKEVYKANKRLQRRIITIRENLP
jgi:hypothetical protein